MKRVELSKPILDKYKYRTGDKEFVGGNPVTLETKNVLSLWQNAFNVTPKVDGTRYLCIMDGSDGNKPIPYFIDRGVGKGMRIFQPFNEKGKTPGPRHFPNCILDGEMVIESSGKTKRWIYWVFDILSFKGTVVSHLSFNQRYDIISRELSFDNQEEKWFLMLPKPYYNMGYFIKEKDPYLSIFKLFSAHCKKLKLKSPELDGLVFNDTIRPYVKGPWKRCDNVQYKWKPSDEQTIDLEVVKKGSKTSFLDKRGSIYSYKFIKNDKEYLLNLSPPKGLPSIARKNKNNVAELRITKIDKKRGVETEWVRWRDDKTANAKLTVDSVINGFLRPVDISDIFSKNPKKIMKYLTKKQLLKIYLRKKIFTASTQNILRGKLKNASDKIVVRFPNKNVPIECLAERGFPSETLNEYHDSTGEYVVLSPSLKVLKHPNKTWTVGNEIKLDTNFIYNTSIEISPRKLSSSSMNGPKKAKKIQKTIFRITGYTNIVFEKQTNEKSGIFYIEAHGGEKLRVLLRLIQMILNL